MTLLRLYWTSVDDDRWSVARTSLSSELLAPHGCLSWHSRREGGEVRVTALWDHHLSAQRFTQGHLVEVLDAADLERPVISHAPLRGLHRTGQRPVLATAA